MHSLDSRSNGAAEEVSPNAGALVGSLRDFGYTLPSALADLVDNSISASAKNIQICIDDSTDRDHIAVSDDGDGMDEAKLVESMRMGGLGPTIERVKTDLGRFGLGLKTAAFSQGRRLTVLTKTSGGSVAHRSWDLDFIAAQNKWQLLANLTSVANGYLQTLSEYESGTVVLIEKLDRPTFVRARNNPDEHLAKALRDVKEHISMVFHRFMSDSVNVYLGGSRLTPWDPFLRGKSTLLGEEVLYVAENPIIVRPYILPHRSKLTKEEDLMAGGVRGWTDHQGFYIYRGGRLILPGSWLGLNLRKELHLSLARIQVDIPNCVDEQWHLNIMKSHVAAPATLRDDLKRIANVVRSRANGVFRFRGEIQTLSTSKDVTPLWNRVETGAGVKFRVNRQHPIIQSLVGSNCEHHKLLSEVLKLIEANLPIASMLQESSRALNRSFEEDDCDIVALKSMFSHAVSFLMQSGKSHPEAKQIVLSSLPFAYFAQELSA